MVRYYYYVCSYLSLLWSWLGVMWCGVLVNLLSVHYVIGCCWLVGAFSDFGRADTGNPVQILAYFVIFVRILGN